MKHDHGIVIWHQQIKSNKANHSESDQFPTRRDDPEFTYLLIIVNLNSKLDYLPHLRNIQLSNNQLSALHPKMFSSLDRLEVLNLAGNPCIDRIFVPVQSIHEIEIELRECGYGLLEQNRGISGADTGFEKIERTLQSINGTLENLKEKTMEVRQNFEMLAELLAKRGEENAKKWRRYAKRTY